jgi:release factor glutamine methyltransferase
MTIQQALANGTQFLQSGWNAERLLMLTLECDRAHLYANPQQILTAQQHQRFEELVAKRAKHYPLAYLEGTQEFFGREFIVNESVLIPRPETEQIIFAVRDLKLPERPVILDLGAGSGILAITLALEISTARVIALEKSFDATRIIQANLRALGVSAVNPLKADFHHCPIQTARVDLIVSNPPYVETNTQLPAETLFEPRLALITENLEETYQSLISEAKRMLKPGGYFVFEIGFGQSDRIRNLCKQSLVSVRKDQQGIDRGFVLKF